MSFWNNVADRLDPEGAPGRTDAPAVQAPGMKHCARCRGQYSEQWDACPNCAPKLDKDVGKIRERLGYIELIVVGAALLSLLASCTR